MKLNVNELSFAYENGKEILHKINFAVESGQFLAVLGPNGAGKSTLFRCLMGAQAGFSGEVALNGRSITSLSGRERAKHIAYIPQIHRPTFGYTVLETVLMGTTRQLGAFSQPKQAQIDTATAALEKVGMAPLAQRSVSHLSGGEFQLTLIARALSQQADILLMDEPTASLDYGNQFRILSRVKELCKQGYAVIISTHDPQHALTFADQVLALDKGTVAAFGETGQVMTAELLHRLYGVEVTFTEADGQTIVVPQKGAWA